LRLCWPIICAHCCRGRLGGARFPFNTPAARAWARELFEPEGAAHQLHFLDVADEVCKARLRARNARGEHPFQASDEI
jgi:predicted kinase